MTLHLCAEDIRALVTPDRALAASTAVIAAEAAGRTVLPGRIDTPSTTGFLRVMPAVLGDVMGLKVMTLVEGVGNRYLVLLYSVATGELLAVFDADEITRLRTAAYTASAALVMVGAAPLQLGVVGTGFEATGHLRMLAHVWPLQCVVAYGRDEGRRVEFAERMTDELGVPVSPAPSVKQAVCDSPVVVLATKNKVPVVDGELFASGATVLSIGSTRPVLRELDRRSLARAGTVVVDDVEQVLAESGDIIDAVGSGTLSRDRLLPLAQATGAGTALHTDADRDLLVFKSVGTALQDLSLASALYDDALQQGVGRDLGELAGLKGASG